MVSLFLKMFSKVLIALVVIEFCYCASKVDDLEVCLDELGCVMGTYLPGYQTEGYQAFLGVPYAEMPTGPLRFKNPVPMKSWNYTIEANAAKPDCVQKNILLDDWYITGEEDCLYMNIYRPVATDKRLPVMFYIFGGGFIIGSSDPGALDPSYFMETQEVILVIPNYRLGPFGFLSTGTVEMPGNLGLKDQQLALKWVEKHIGSFGGNPKAVTIFGHSAGASSVQLHMMSQGSRDLFNAAILGSGNALAPYVDVIEEPYQQVLKIAESLEIHGAAKMDIKSLIEKLQSYDSHCLLMASDALQTWQRFPVFSFRPTIEQKNWPEAFITDSPEMLWKNGKKIFEVPTMQSLVSNRGEGAVYTLRIWTHHDMREEFNSQFDERLWSLMELPLKCSNEKRQNILSSIVEEYFGGVREMNNSTINGFSELFGDVAFYYPFWKSTKFALHHLSPSNPVYLLKFNYRSQRSRAFLYNGGPSIQYGVVHMDDLLFLFRSPQLFPKDFEKDSADAKLAKDMVGLYVEFAKNRKLNDVTYCTEEKFNANNDSSICDYIEFHNHIGTGYEKIIHNEFNKYRMHLWENILEDK